MGPGLSFICMDTRLVMVQKFIVAMDTHALCFCNGNACAGLQFYAYEGSEVDLWCYYDRCTCDDENMSHSGRIACPEFPNGIPTLDVVKNEILNVKDDVKYDAIWKTMPTVLYGVLLVGISLCVMLIYSFYIKRNQKEYQ